MSTRIENIRVLYIGTDKRGIQWDVIFAEPGVKFFVERSAHPTDNFEQIAGPLVNNYYLDENIPVINRNATIYYRIRIEDIGMPVVYSESVSLPFLLVGHAKSIIKEESHFLRKFIKRPIKVYIRKKWGERCSYCWDDIKKRVKSEKCSYCYGTGFNGGYNLPPIETYMQIDNSPKAEIPSPIGPQVPNETRVWTSNFPILTPGDVINDLNTGTRYRIKNVNFTSFQGYIIRQILDLYIINIGEIEYSLS